MTVNNFNFGKIDYRFNVKVDKVFYGLFDKY